MEGYFPSKQLAFMKIWTDLHKGELIDNFNNLRAEIQTFKKIKPLE